MRRTTKVIIGIRSISDANNHTLSEIIPRAEISKIDEAIKETSKPVTGIIIVRMAAVKYFMSDFRGLKANCIPNIAIANATKNETIVRITWRGSKFSIL